MIPWRFHLEYQSSSLTLQYLQQTRSPVESLVTFDATIYHCLQDVVNEVLQEIGLDAWKFHLFRFRGFQGSQVVGMLHLGCDLKNPELRTLMSGLALEACGNFSWFSASEKAMGVLVGWAWLDSATRGQWKRWNASVKNLDSCFCLQSFLPVIQVLKRTACLRGRLVDGNHSGNCWQADACLLCKLNRIFTPKVSTNHSYRGWFVHNMAMPRYTLGGREHKGNVNEQWNNETWIFKYFSC